jgi:hypothetical protein
MNEVYGVFIVSWVNEFDGDTEMYVAATREIANEFASRLESEGLGYKIDSRPIQFEGDIPSSAVVTADYSEGMVA